MEVWFLCIFKNIIIKKMEKEFDYKEWDYIINEL